MSNITKARFFQRPSVKGLPKQEKERRWKQHLMSLGGEAPRNNRRPSRRNKVAIGRMRTMQEDERCGLEYATSLVNPFDFSLNPCIPRMPSVPSRKLCTYASGLGNTSGTTSYGGVTAYMTAANDTTGVAVTETAFTGSYLPAWNSTGALSKTQNSPYASADFSATGVQVRLVSAGLKVRFVGTKLNQGGICFPFLEPDLGDVTGYTANDIALFDQYFQGIDFNNDWVSITYTPRHPADFDFAAADKPLTGQHPCMGILILSATPNQPFEYVWTAHWEVIGRNARGKTLSHTYPNTDRIISGASQFPPRALSSIQNAPRPESLASQVGRNLMAHGAGVVETLGKGALNMVGTAVADTMVSGAAGLLAIGV